MYVKLIKRILLTSAVLSSISTGLVTAQVKITDESSLVMDPNAILELESNNKGLLLPQVPLNDLNSPAPMTGPVPERMLVYSKNGNVADGFYYWDGIMWKSLGADNQQSVITYSRNTDDTLLKVSSLVFASNDVTLTLPELTASDTGLSVTVRNSGDYTDLVTVRGYGSSLIEEMSQYELLPHEGTTFTARGPNWIINNRKPGTMRIIDVGPQASFPTLNDAVEFLEDHMSGPSVIRLTGENEEITSTIVIDLPYPLTIQGISYGVNTIAPGPGLSGKPMFRCLTESYFKMLVFDATLLPGYGSSAGEDAVRLTGSGTYHEIKDCTFDGFYNAIVDSSDAELWLFECDISNASNAGLIIDSNVQGTKVRISETDFIGCATGVYLSKGESAVIEMMSGVFSNNPGGHAIRYDPLNFSFKSLIISNNSWNRIGFGLSGFDFSRSDGRDANAYIENNPGIRSNTPNCKINVVNNSSTITCTAANTWYLANWVNTSSFATNIEVDNNKITYQPDTHRNLVIFISGNVKVSSNNRVITIGVAKNGNTGTIFGETALRVTTANQPFQFSTVVYLEDVVRNDYFQMYCSSSNAGDILTFQDINWFVTAED